MPHLSLCNQLLDELDEAELALTISKYKHALHTMTLSNFSNFDSDSDLNMVLTPLSPLTPQLSDYSDLDSDLNSDDESTHVVAHYDCLHDTITSLCDEVSRAHVLQKPDTPPMQAPQIHLLHDFGTSCTHLFQKKLL
ncbi:hypothetical protein BDR06DRAFT_1002144 [Suillus hirtellus]|nr:hypothetical protein BDR06DRAFT_1002144 [Suillus hirtellus]